MSDLLAGDLKSFRDELKGRVVTADDADYDAVPAQCVWNGEIDRRPWVIARARSAEDVAAAVRFAQDTGRDLAVRGGGHNFSGSCIADDAVMIDLGGLWNQRRPAREDTRCGGGARWSQLDAATQEHALAVPAGSSAIPAWRA